MTTHDQTLDRFSGTATIVLTLLGWSSIPLFLKYFSRDIDAWTANGWRYAFSALLWAPVLVWARRTGNTPPGLWKAAVLPSVFNAMGQMLFGLAPYYVDPGLMTFSLRMQIVFVTVGAALLFPSERRIVRTPLFMIGLAMVFAGTMGTIALKPGGMGSGTTFGVIMSIASGLLFACYALAVRHSMHGVNPLIAFAAISQYTAVGLLVPMLLVGHESGLGALQLSARGFGLLLLSSLIGIGLGHTFYYVSIARLGVAVSSGVIQLQPFIVAASSYFLFGERLTPFQWASGVLAVLGAGVILLVQQRLGMASTAAPEPQLCESCGVDLGSAPDRACPQCGSPRPSSA